MVNCCKGLATLLPKCSTFVILVVVVINLFIIHHFGVLITTRLSIEFEELRNRLSQDSEELSNRLSADFKQLKIHSSNEIQQVKTQLSNEVQVLTDSSSKDSLAISSRLSTELQQLPVLKYYKIGINSDIDSPEMMRILHCAYFNVYFVPRDRLENLNKIKS